MRLNLAERAGRWSAAHWKSATAVWVAFVAVAIVVDAVAGTRTLTDGEQSDGEAARAAQVLAAAGFRDRADESVLVQSRTLTVGDSSFRRTVRSVVATLRHRPEVTRLRPPLARVDGQVSRDRHSALVEFALTGDVATAGDRVQPVLDAVAAAQKAHPAFVISEFGQASA